MKKDIVTLKTQNEKFIIERNNAKIVHPDNCYHYTKISGESRIKLVIRAKPWVTLLPFNLYRIYFGKGKYIEKLQILDNIKGKL